MHFLSAESESLSARLLSVFFKFGRTPWHIAPANGLSQAETDILLNIMRANRHNRILRVSDLSALLRVSSPTITQHLNNLERQGFVERAQAKEDKRAVNLSLTDKGNDALKSHWKALEDNVTELIGIIGEENAETMISLFAKANEFFVQKAKAYAEENLF